MANYPSWMVPPPPVDPALAGAPGTSTPPWLADALAAQSNDSATRQDAGPPPGAPPPFSAELAGAPGAPPAPGQPQPSAGGAPFWATPDGIAPGSFQGQDVPVVEGGQGLQLQQQPVVGAPKNGPAGKAGPAPTPERQQRPMTYADVLRQQAGEEQGSIAREGALEAEQAQTRAAGLAKQAEYEQASIKDRQLTEMKRRQDLAQREDKLETERQAIANTKIDDTQWYNSKSDGQKASMVIGAFMGGMLSVSTGSGKNDFTDWMDAQVRQNIESQKAMIANRQESLGHGEQMYGKLAQRYNDERTADEMFASAMYTSIGHEAAAQAAQFDSPKAKENAMMMSIQAGQRANQALQNAAVAQQESDLKKQQVGIQGYEARTGRMNAETQRMNEQDDAAAKKAALEAKAAGKGLPVTGSKGQIIGYANSEEGQKAGRQVVSSKLQLDVLYKRGLELFKGGWANPGSEERARQDAWNANWAQARRLASGDTSAPNKDDAVKWGLDTSRTLTNQNMAVLDESYNNARDLAAAALGPYGVDEKTLEAEGYIPPPKAPTPGKADPILYYDEATKTYNSEGRGTPLTPEASQRERARATSIVNDEGAHGVWYDAATRTYNVRGVGERLSPQAEAQVRADPSRFHIDLGPAEASQPDSEMWQQRSMQGQGMPGTADDQDWSVVEPKYRPKGWKPKDKR